MPDRQTRVGWVLHAHVLAPLGIVHKLHVIGTAVLKSEDDSPVAGYGDGPEAGQLSLQGMESIAWQSHVLYAKESDRLYFFVAGRSMVLLRTGWLRRGERSRQSIWCEGLSGLSGLSRLSCLSRARSQTDQIDQIPATRREKGPDAVQFSRGFFSHSLLLNASNSLASLNLRMTLP